MTRKELGADSDPKLYLSGNAVIILEGPHEIIQTIYLDHCDELLAVVLHESTGKIAIASRKEIFIYKPFGDGRETLKWILDVTLQLPNDGVEDVWLSWGSEEELLTGKSHLDLFRTKREGRRIWHQELPKPVKYAIFSPDATIIATAGEHDRLIKLWRRQSFEEDDTRFDFSYLPHPASVTSLRWRHPPEHDHRSHERAVDYVLYSTCVDGKIRIWAMTNLHDVAPMHLWAQIDTLDCLQPRGIENSSENSERMVAFFDRAELAKAELAFSELQSPVIGNEDRQRGHLSEILDSESDVCIVFDRRGNMSTWGLSNIGCPDRQLASIVNISHVQDAYLALQPNKGPLFSGNVVVQCFLNDQGQMTFLVHQLDSMIFWQTSDIEKFLDPLPCPERLTPRSVWTGHRKPIRKLLHEATNQSLLSWAEDGEALLWICENGAEQHVLSLATSFSWGETVRCCCVLPGGTFLVTSNLNELVLWDASCPLARVVARCPNHMGGSIECLAPRSGPQDHIGIFYIFAVNNIMEGLVYKVTVPTRKGTATEGLDTQPHTISKYCQVTTSVPGPFDSITYTSAAEYTDLHADSKISSAPVSLVGCTSSGTVCCYALKADATHSSASVVQTSSFHTGISQPALCHGSFTQKIAIVDSAGLKLQIWDAKACYLEYNEDFGSAGVINCLDSSCTTDTKCLVAVGSTHHVTILAQARVNHDARSKAWAPIKEIHTKSLNSYPLGDIAWLSYGNLVIGAGNQLYVCSEHVDGADELVMALQIPNNKSAGQISMSTLLSSLNQPIPVFHHQFVCQVILAGKLDLSAKIIMTLHGILKYFAPGDSLDILLSMPSTHFYLDSERRAVETDVHQDNDDADTWDAGVAVTLSETLVEVELPHLTSQEHSKLSQIIKSLSFTYEQRQAMDLNGLRYHHVLNEHAVRARSSDQSESVSWREIVWAQHSTSQEILADFVTRKHRGKLGWEEARASGMFSWLTDKSALETQFETVARNEYSKTEERNPIDCSLYYLALRKKNVLIGLWRMATWNREQSGTQKLLKNDFTQARWRTAASKNAFALLGKRRYEYAAAWFLLADKLQDAVSICANQMNDIQLAVAVARVYAGDDSPVLHALLKQKALPQAAYTGDRWQATWAFTMLQQNDMAVRALIEPLHDLVHIDGAPQTQAFSYQAHDPLLTSHYRQIRDEALKKSPFTWPVPTAVESRFVLNAARSYERMGCGLLAIDLLRNWKFTPASEKPTPSSPTIKKERRKSTRRRSSAKVSTKVESPVKEKPKPTMFEEPSANSLLDNFGF